MHQRLTLMVDVLRACRDSRSGVAATEFALALPMLLGAALAGIEVSNLAMVHLRVNQIGMATADNAARVRRSIDEADIRELLIGAELAGRAIGFKQRGRLVLSSLEPNAHTDGRKGQWIRWQRCLGDKAFASAYGAEGKGQNDNSLQGMGTAANRIQATTGTSVMFVEVAYDYRPLIANQLPIPRTIKYNYAFNVRDRVNQPITNLQSGAVARCS